MSDKWLIISVAGLGFRDLETRGMLRLAGLDFHPAQTVFPAVTCTAQASFRTATLPRAHGMTFNGVYSRTLRKAAFWEQSADLVQGARIWDAARAGGKTVGMYFWQQSLGEALDSVISPAPIHTHGGGTIMQNYTLPRDVGTATRAAHGTFPLHRYWGPFAHPKVGDAIVDVTQTALQVYTPDILFLYIPTLDYDLQRFGPGSPKTEKSFAFLRRQLERLAHLAERENRQLLIFGDYAITDVTLPPAHPNRTLRQAGFLAVRDINGRAYHDLFSSRAFAMADHEIAHVFIRRPEDIAPVRAALEATGEYSEIRARVAESGCDWGHPSAGELLLVAKPGSWIAYPWWTDRREAPDYATHIDIHSKPGYDPCELFFEKCFPPSTCQDASRIRGTHGRNLERVAFASTAPLPSIADDAHLIDIAQSLGEQF